MTRDPEPESGSETTEADMADVAEQHTPAGPDDAGGDDPIPSVEVPLDADPADVLEQAQEVPYDDDER